MTDKEVVDAFVDYLRAHGHPGLTVDSRPDQENRNTRDIDAIAGPFAIEHTSVDTVEGQRKATAQFKIVVGGIREELRGQIAFRLNITVEWSAIRVGQDWARIRGSLKDWILTEAPSLEDGRYIIDDGMIRGVPFMLTVKKASDRPPGILFGRLEPGDNTLPVRIRKLLDNKAEKLAKYHPEKTTILLVESNDMALMNQCILLVAIKTAYSGTIPGGVDQVWYADTTVPESEVVFMDFTRELRGVD